jgi:hypothetical protein
MRNPSNSLFMKNQDLLASGDENSPSPICQICVRRAIIPWLQKHVKGYMLLAF